MPFVEVTLVEGRPPELLRDLIHRLHAAVVASIGADPASVRIVLREVAATHWAAADQTIAERRAASEHQPGQAAGAGSTAQRGSAADAGSPAQPSRAPEDND